MSGCRWFFEMMLIYKHLTINLCVMWKFVFEWNYVISAKRLHFYPVETFNRLNVLQCFCSRLTSLIASSIYTTHSALIWGFCIQLDIVGVCALRSLLHSWVCFTLTPTHRFGSNGNFCRIHFHSNTGISNAQRFFATWMPFLLVDFQ